MKNMLTLSLVFFIASTVVTGYVAYKYVTNKRASAEVKTAAPIPSSVTLRQKAIEDAKKQGKSTYEFSVDQLPPPAAGQ